MIDRIFKSWKSSLLGVGIIAACLVMVFAEKATLTEVGVFIAGGLYALYYKGKDNGPKL